MSKSRVFKYFEVGYGGMGLFSRFGRVEEVEERLLLEIIFEVEMEEGMFFGFFFF